MPIESFLNAAGRWFLESGIQERSGGVARYFHTDTHENHRISTEITGYSASALLYLYELTKDRRYLLRAQDAGLFLCRCAWDAALSAMPFEWTYDASHPEQLTYFFDAGIITRALLAIWRHTGDREYLDTALACGRSMERDFRVGPREFHPILRLPDKRPLERDARWSRSPGCYQLKAAMAWLELSEVTGDQDFAALYEEVLEQSLRTHEEFLPGHPDLPKVMDRLHAYSYFLEGLLPVLDRPRCRRAAETGLVRAGSLFRQIAPQFERSDVSAQLLRVRILGESLAGIAMDGLAAETEATAVSSFFVRSTDLRMNGGLFFGRTANGVLPFVNPVSTAFGLQAVAMWALRQQGKRDFSRHSLI